MQPQTDNYLKFPGAEIYYRCTVALNFPPGILAIASAIAKVREHLYYEMKVDITHAEINIEGFNDKDSVWEILIEVISAGLSRQEKHRYCVRVVREGNLNFVAHIDNEEE